MEYQLQDEYKKSHFSCKISSPYPVSAISKFLNHGNVAENKIRSPTVFKTITSQRKVAQSCKSEKCSAGIKGLSMSMCLTRDTFKGIKIRF